MAHITVVNDNAEFLDLVREILEDDRYEVTTVDGDRSDALERIKDSRPDALMIDLRLGSDGLHGWDIAMEVRRDASLSELPVLVCSADIEALKQISARLDDTHHVETLTKPFSIDALTDRVDRLLAQPISG
jgi:CheY-like chemotaxis protein